MPDDSFEVKLVAAQELSAIAEDWDCLASRAVEANPFYERWMLLPSLEAAGVAGDVRAALIWHRSQANAKARLAGMIPLFPASRWRGIPVSAAENVMHLYCSSGAPLLDAEHAPEALGAFFDWLKAGSAFRVAVFRKIPTDGQFHRLLVDLLYSRTLVYSVYRRYTRALFCKPDSPRDYVAGQFSGRTLKHLRRQKETLSEQGNLEMRRLGEADDLSAWVEEFLRLESAGWKGTAGTALSSTKSHEMLFRGVTGSAREQQRLRMSGLWLNGRLIAARTSFRAGDGCFLFKIAYDEAYAKQSPGMLLELERILQPDADAGGWEDSCTAPDNTVYRRLWRHRRTIEDLAISSGSPWGDLAISAAPLLRFLKARVRGRREKNAPSA